MSSATRKTKALAGQAVKAPAKSLPFIQGRVADGFWIIGSPLIALAAMGALWRWSGASDLAVYSILFGFIVTGHHHPGWFRAFGEPAVYQRFKARLWVSVLAVPALVILPTAFGQTGEALAILDVYRDRHPGVRVAPDLDRAIHADAAARQGAVFRAS